MRPPPPSSGGSPPSSSVTRPAVGCQHGRIGAASGFEARIYRPAAPNTPPGPASPPQDKHSPTLPRRAVTVEPAAATPDSQGFVGFHGGFHAEARSWRLDARLDGGGSGVRIRHRVDGRDRPSSGALATGNPSVSLAAGAPPWQAYRDAVEHSDGKPAWPALDSGKRDPVESQHQRPMTLVWIDQFFGAPPRRAKSLYTEREFRESGGFEEWINLDGSRQVDRHRPVSPTPTAPPSAFDDLSNYLREESRPQHGLHRLRRQRGRPVDPTLDEDRRRLRRRPPSASATTWSSDARVLGRDRRPRRRQGTTPRPGRRAQERL